MARNYSGYNFFGKNITAIEAGKIFKPKSSYQAINRRMKVYGASFEEAILYYPLLELIKDRHNTSTPRKIKDFEIIPFKDANNVFKIDSGKDLIITLSKDSNGKTVIQIVDDEDRSPLTEDFDLGMSWINDSKKWDEVYTVKPYKYMEIIVKGGIPVWDKVNGGYIDSQEKAEKDRKAAEEELKENLTEHKRDFSDFPKESTETKSESTSGIFINSEDDLPF